MIIENANNDSDDNSDDDYENDNTSDNDENNDNDNLSFLVIFLPQSTTILIFIKSFTDIGIRIPYGGILANRHCCCVPGRNHAKVITVTS